MIRNGLCLLFTVNTLSCEAQVACYRYGASRQSTVHAHEGMDAWGEGANGLVQVA